MSEIDRETEEKRKRYEQMFPQKTMLNLVVSWPYLKQEIGIFYQSAFGYGSLLTVDLVSGLLLQWRQLQS